MKFWVVIPAAGIGSRMQADRPKQYLALFNKTVIEHTLDCFFKHSGVWGIVVAIAQNDPYWAALSCATDPRVQSVLGGKERADSVLNGLQHLQSVGANEQDWVLVHDAARPNLSQSDLSHLVHTLAADGVGGLLAVPAKDTLKQVDSAGRIAQTLDRSSVWQALTPQMFRLGPLRQALTQALAAGVAITDEASAMEWAGFSPQLVEGRSDNLKITRPEDLKLLSALWAQGN
ncbi:2-C-methyl-D-erythritol 4-phosphate cytidylyltransferase [Pseudomonas sp. F1_0610]|uniref:2-C-methyl-D-erythritol 4-phosphate cytidylyltransferase n=1 Tax=Pseudomonas sp. F1_0610 TaxID=3114284 RepID=UPI0039C434FD